MIWDYKTNLPVEGSYQKHQYDKSFLNDYLMELLGGDLFFLTNEDENCRWAKLSGRPIQENDIIKRLYFCDCEEDIWDMIYDLPGDVASNLCLLYETKSKSCLYEPWKAWAMLAYFCSKDDWLKTKAFTQSIVIMINGKLILGNVILLKEYTINVALLKPIKYTYTYDYGDYKLVDRAEDGSCRLTPEGEERAIYILRKIYNDVAVLLDDTDKIKSMLDHYHDLEAKNTNRVPPQDMLSKIHKEYFPEIKYIDFNIYLMEEIEKYLDNGEIQ